jgi:hypothetical protein
MEVMAVADMVGRGAWGGGERGLRIELRLLE